jgi:hypothetical protein
VEPCSESSLVDEKLVEYPYGVNDYLFAERFLFYNVHPPPTEQH